MKFYEVNVHYKGMVETQTFNESTHAESRINENNLYNRANSFIIKVQKECRYESIDLVEVDTVRYEKRVIYTYLPYKNCVVS